MYDLTPPPDSQKAESDCQKIVAVLENQVADLQKQLELSNERETALIDEKSKLLDLLSAEKEEKRLMLPAPQKRTGFFGLFRKPQESR